MLELIDIEGIGTKTLELLKKLNINSVEDLLYYYPFRYDILKRSDVNNLSDGEKVIIDGVVEGQPTTIFLSNKLKKNIFRISNKNIILNVTIYNKTYLYQELKCGKEVTIIGKYDKIKNTVVAEDIRFEKLPSVPKIEPIYYTTSGLSKKSISKFAVYAIRKNCEIKDYLPRHIIEKYNFMSKKEALFHVHFPMDIMDLKKARQRIKYEELFMYMLKINYLRRRNEVNENCIKREIDISKVNEFLDMLPFKLTFDQKKVVDEIINDMQSQKKMNRLLQGDVGSGKTIVAFIAMYVNYLSGYQTLLMAPTEILARQHYENAVKLFKDLGVKIELLTSGTKNSKKSQIYDDLSEGKIDFLIGTQAVIQDKVIFNNLGLVITDEQHRFGVNQRNKAKNKGNSPDILSMSATPIPRTYALTIYGDVDVSNIKTKPEGRKEVKTYIKKEKDIIDVLAMMKNELELKHQIYVIAPQVEDNESDIETVNKLEEKMNKAFGKVYNIGKIHGKSDSKEDIMKKFEDGVIDILISTTVVEVGVNVPNASMIVIFNANMFGLSTLHQLRGRVGRGNSNSYCVLIAKQNIEKLKILEKTNDGFEISDFDFQNRGEGDLFGIRQSGETGLIMANVNRDFKMLLRAKEDVENFVDTLFTSDLAEYENIKNALSLIENLD